MTNQMVTLRGLPELRPVVVNFTVEAFVYFVRSATASPQTRFSSDGTDCAPLPFALRRPLPSGRLEGLETRASPDGLRDAIARKRPLLRPNGYLVIRNWSQAIELNESVPSVDAIGGFTR